MPKCFSIHKKTVLYNVEYMLCALTLENAYVDGNTYSDFYICAVYVKVFGVILINEV